MRLVSTKLLFINILRLNIHAYIEDLFVQTFCKVLILLRNKDLVSPVEILKLFFELFRCSDKVLRETLKNYIIHDIKNINMKSKNVSLNSVGYIIF